MVNFCLKDEEKNLLKSLIGKKLKHFKHDPFDKFEGETVYGNIELFFDDLIVLIQYDYEPYPLFGDNTNDHPKFSIKVINEEDAISAFQNTQQISIKCDKVITGITLVEDYVNVEWDGKKDEVRMMKAIILKLDDKEVAIQGDYMMPLLDIFKGINLKNVLGSQADEFEDDETKYEAKRFFIEL